MSMSRNNGKAGDGGAKTAEDKATTRTRATARKLAVDRQALREMGQVLVAYSHVEREWFPSDEAYEAEVEVEKRAQQVVEALRELKIGAGACPADRYFLAKLFIDKPALVLNLVDTVRGRDALQVSVPGALELTDIPYTGAGMRGLVIGNDRALIKELLDANAIPTPPFQFITRRGQRIHEEIGLPLIVKLNESGGSVGIDNQAVKESYEAAQERADELIATYKIPVIVERFIDGPEITVAVFDDGQQVHVYCGEKVFKAPPDGKHLFTSIESYRDPQSYTYKKPDRKVVERVTPLARQAYRALQFRDYAKFDVRVDETDGTPYFTDANPNTAFGPHIGLPFTEVLDLHRIKFSTVLASLMSKHARRIARAAPQPAP
jgi:D-alanine-D-alanine ligase